MVIKYYKMIRTSLIRTTKKISHSFDARYMAGLPKFHKLMETVYDPQMKTITDSTKNIINDNVDASVESALKIMEETAEKIQHSRPHYHKPVRVTGSFNLGIIKIEISTEV